MSSSSSLVFKVERCEPVLVPPATPTPYEFKLLSDIDDQKGYRINYPDVHFYHNNEAMQGKDPVKVIKEAIAKTLVFYYPFAGRLREGPNEKLMVECTGEGVLFIEANADVRLEQFGDVLIPPFPCAEELLYDVPGSDDILHSPLLVIQVTRLKCGGFIFALRLNHTMADATGLVQFLKAIGEMARGAEAPSVLPVWKREHFKARVPPQVSCVHRVYQELPEIKGLLLEDPRKFAQRPFFFGQEEVTRLRNHVPSHLKSCSKFEIITACLWRCHTIALNLNPDVEVRVAFPVNARKKFNPPLPAGFYGNAIGTTVAQSTSGKLCQNPFGYALELVKKANAEVNDEFMRSLTDFLVKNGRPHITPVRTFFVADLSRMGFNEVDFGWGKALYGGSLWSGPPSFFMSLKNNKGEDGVAVPIHLPGPNLEKFAKEIDKLTGPNQTNSSFIASSL